MDMSRPLYWNRLDTPLPDRPFKDVLTAACLCLLVTRQNERAGERRVYVGGELCRRLLMSDVFICHDDLDAAGAPCALSSSPPIETSLTWAWRNVIVLRLKVSRASRPEVG